MKFKSSELVIYEGEVCKVIRDYNFFNSVEYADIYVMKGNRNYVFKVPVRSIKRVSDLTVVERAIYEV